MAIVYQHKRLDTNEIFYIGIGKTILRAKSKKSRNALWWNIVNKTQYEIIILKSNLTWEQACKVECEEIKKYGRRDLGTGILVNMTDGGEGMLGYEMKPHSKELISIANKGKKRTEEQKQHLSEILKGCNNPNFGNKWSDEQKEVARLNALEWSQNNPTPFKGKHHTIETKETLRQQRLGTKHKSETIKSFKETRKGANNSCSKLTEEIVIWIREEYAKTKISTYKLAEMFNVSRPTISSVIKRKTWTHI